MAEPRLRVLISASDIHTRIQELGQQITSDYSADSPLYLIGILKGAIMFHADLARAIQKPRVRLDFIGISSYGKGKSSSGQVKLTKDLDVTIEGADVLIVEDIIDTGITLTYLIGVIEQRKPRSIRIAAFLDKPDRRLRPVSATYLGFTIPDEFVVGYGLDFAEEYRHLRDLCVLESESP
ncbi:MAG: hypoxanthine phosphoribosyltransferase [Bryobacteraceae bacterium]|nr:hypoxanthine phosphoribosyltransferase [Bryobacteraceae bacterium]